MRQSAKAKEQLDAGVPKGCWRSMGEKWEKEKGRRKGKWAEKGEKSGEEMRKGKYSDAVKKRIV